MEALAHSGRRFVRSTQLEFCSSPWLAVQPLISLPQLMILTLFVMRRGLEHDDVDEALLADDPADGALPDEVEAPAWS